MYIMDSVINNIQDVERIDIKEIKQNFDNSLKLKHGYVPTPFSIIEKLINTIPNELFKNIHLKWLDPGCGNGYISMIIYKKLFSSIRNQFKSNEDCRNHILDNMLYMVDIHDGFINNLCKIFGNQSNVIHINFLYWEPGIKFDVIICNPPYVCQGLKKVPTNNDSEKINDGITIWPEFIRKCILLLKDYSYLSTIIPSIWMKPDNKMYNFLIKYKINSLCCYSNTETKKLFSGHAQTPTSSFVLKNEKSSGYIQVYDKTFSKNVNYKLMNEGAIPVFGISIIEKLIPFLHKYGSLYKGVVKTNMPSKKVAFYDELDDVYKYKNIITCKLNENKIPYLIFNYSNKPLKYCGDTKLVLAHKMYGHPYYDESGIYGISNRDNYLILGKTDGEFKKLKDFLNTKLVRFLYESTRYRMKYLEKYAFDFIVDICKIEDFPEIINDENILNYFGFDEKQRKVILGF